MLLYSLQLDKRLSKQLPLYQNPLEVLQLLLLGATYELEISYQPVLLFYSLNRSYLIQRQVRASYTNLSSVSILLLSLLSSSNLLSTTIYYLALLIGRGGGSIIQPLASIAIYTNIVAYSYSNYTSYLFVTPASALGIGIATTSRIIGIARSVAIASRQVNILY